jgi:urease accessory protein
MLSPTRSLLANGNSKPQVPNWQATLKLDFAPNPHWADQPTQTRVQFEHSGPLRVQKALYPEGPKICHVILVHPPGGIAGGDELQINAAIQSHGAALVTTPGATRWYGSSGHLAQQHVALTIHGDCEWLPMETIVFDGANGNSTIDIDCAPSGRMIGWDTLIFARQSAGEDFAQGLFCQNISCRFDNTLVWQERTRLAGNDPMFASALGYQKHRAAGTIWAIRAQDQPWQQTEIEALRSLAPQVAWSILWPRLLVGRLLGSPIEIKNHLDQSWHQLRPLVLGQNAIAPRIWST